MPITKQCSKCKAELPASAFNRDRKRDDELQAYCRDCQKADYQANKAKRLRQANEWTQNNREKRRAATRRWKKRNPEKISEMNRKYRAKNPEVGKRNVALYYERNPGREKVNRLVRKAVEAGTLVKPPRCERCRLAKESRQLVGHHRDYSKALEVEWLCRPCHIDRHKEERGETPRTEPAPSPQDATESSIR